MKYNTAMKTEKLRPLYLLPVLLALQGCSGRSSVSYSRDIEPLIHSACLECHTFDFEDEDARAEGNFSVDSYVTLIQGGDSGLVINLSDPASSKLPKILRGEAPMYENDGDHFLIINQQQRDMLQVWIDDGLPGN